MPELTGGGTLGGGAPGGGQLGGAIISGGLGLINSAIQRGTNRIDAQRQFAHNKEQAALANKHDFDITKFAYDKDLEQWGRQNAYNTPEAQRKRFEQAGFNPNLLYQQGNPGNAGPGPAHGVTKYQNVTADYKNLGSIKLPNAIEQYQNIGLRGSQNKKIQAQIERENTNNRIDRLTEELNETNLPSRVQEQLVKVLAALKAMNVQDEVINLSQDVQRQTQQQTKNLKEDEKYKKFKSGLAQQGLTDKDNVLMRMLGIRINKSGNTTGKIKKWIMEGWQGNWDNPGVKKTIKKGNIEAKSLWEKWKQGTQEWRTKMLIKMAEDEQKGHGDYRRKKLW